MGFPKACAAAGRLAAANPELEILLVEQGPNNLNNPAIITPALVLANLAPDSKNTLFWQGNKSAAINGRSPIVASGGVLGGGSSINFATYARPSLSDFDDWNTPGWTSKDLIPILKKIETYCLNADLETHGYNGPVHVSYSNYYASVAQEFLDISVRKGVPLVDDMWDLKTGHGCQRLAKFIHPITSHRQDAAHCYVHPQINNKSLHVLTMTQVVRVLFDGVKATGVQVVSNKNQDSGVDQTPRTITARKLVVISAGAIGSPMILQRSGIGCGGRLGNLGIPTISDLPDVGRHYEDHSSLIAVFHVPDDAETLDCIIDQVPGFMDKHLVEFAKGRGFLTTNGCDAGCKLRPTPEELKDMGPEFQDVFKRRFEQAPDKPVLLQTLFNGYLGPRSMVPDGKRFMMIGNIQTYPISRGHVYITSTDPYAPPDFDTGFLNEQADIDVLVWGYKKSREIARRMPSFRGEYAGLHPRFPNGSSAGCVRLNEPPPDNMEDLTYSHEDSMAIEAFVRETASTTWHSIGTVPMRPKEQGGCVDARLDVYGAINLKVADLSVLPNNVGANTNLTALLIGEKAAIIIAEDLGLNVP